jgi:hypothetical protein
MIRVTYAESSELSKQWMSKLYERPKAFQMAWPLICNPRSRPQLVKAGQIELPSELLKDRGSASHQKWVRLAMALYLKNFSGGGTTKQLWGGYEFGSQIDLQQFPIWSAVKLQPGSGRLAILSIQHCVPNNLTSSLNGKMLSTKILKEW